MAGLKQLRDGLHRVSPTTRYLAPATRVEQSRSRDIRLAWRAWYKTARWQKLRWTVLVRDQFTCQLCGRIEANTSKLVGDHKVRHRGDPTLFWDAANIQCLCKSCHDSDKQRAERTSNTG